MTWPVEYQRATDDFHRFLDDAREAADLTSKNAAYTMVQGVLQAFRRRLELADAIRFAQVLPALVRALFVADWDPAEPRRAFGDRAEMTAEARALREQHNFSPDHAIVAVATALRKNADPDRLDRVLAGLPPVARDFWAV